jgi:hypothetical protein
MKLAQGFRRDEYLRKPPLKIGHEAVPSPLATLEHFSLRDNLHKEDLSIIRPVDLPQSELNRLPTAIRRKPSLCQVTAII